MLLAAHRISQKHSVGTAENIKCTVTMFSVYLRSCGKHLVTVSCHLMIFPNIRNWENHSDKDGILSLDDFNT